MKILLLLTTCILILVGCTTTPQFTAAQIASADYGPYPENYGELVREWFSTHLVDPESMELQFKGVPYKGYCHDRTYVKPGQEFGWGVLVDVNSKTRSEGYTAPMEYSVFIRYGKVICALESVSIEAVGVEPVDKLVPEGAKR